jgi:hypothetical protein
MTKMGIPKIGWFATSQDTEGNVWNNRIRQEGQSDSSETTREVKQYVNID